MCGIAAIIAPAPAHDLIPAAGRMLEIMRHRGPDAAHVRGFDARGPVENGAAAHVALAGNRLAIQDLSPAGAQPMVDPSGRYWIVFNGEIYNFIELREEMERAGETFVSRCDTEVLLRMLARDGRDALPKLDGMFAIVMLDLHERRVLLVRDRFGIKPYYYWRAPDGRVCLASEIKAFTALDGWDPLVNGARARDYLTRGLIDHTPETMFAGVRQLPPGHLAEIDLDRVTTPTPERWFTLTPDRPQGTIDDWAERVADLLSASVARRLRADVTVGSCLSGGLDSSAVVCLAAETLREQNGGAGQKTFTARPGDPRLDEWGYARAAADTADAVAIEVNLDGTAFFESIDRLVWTQDEPFATPSIFAQDRVFAAASAHGVKVMLDGQGADEQLAGYHAFFRVHLLELFRRGRFFCAHQAAYARRRHHGYGVLRQLADTAATALPAGTLAMLRRPRLVDELIDLDAIAPAWSDPFGAMTGRRRGVSAFSIDQLTAGSLPMLLHWEDRNAMAHAVEARVPFLCPALVQLILGLPSSAKLDAAVTKVVLRRAMKGHVPEPIRTRNDKLAFETPDRRWFCETHRDAARDALAASTDAIGPLLRSGAARTLEAITAGDRPYDPALWRVICFGAWLRRFGARV